MKGGKNMNNENNCYEGSILQNAYTELDAWKISLKQYNDIEQSLNDKNEIEKIIEDEELEEIQDEIRSKMKRIKQMVKRGRKLVFPDINRIEQLMLEELAQEKEKANKLDAKIVHADERRTPKDTYLESQRATLEAAELMLKHGTPEQKAAAEKLKATTLKNIKKREKILRDDH